MTVEFFHYTEGVNRTLKGPLTSALYDHSTSIKKNEALSYGPGSKVVALVHKSKEAEVDEVVSDCDLIILFSQGGGRPAVDKTSKPSRLKWTCGTEVLTKHFSNLKEHLEKKDSPDDWRHDAWVPTWPESLVAAYLLQCANSGGICSEISTDDLPWAQAMAEFNEQVEKFEHIKPIAKISLDQGKVEVALLLAEIAKAQAA